MFTLGNLYGHGHPPQFRLWHAIGAYQPTNVRTTKKLKPHKNIRLKSPAVELSTRTRIYKRWPYACYFHSPFFIPFNLADMRELVGVCVFANAKVLIIFIFVWTGRCEWHKSQPLQVVHNHWWFDATTSSSSSSIGHNGVANGHSTICCSTLCLLLIIPLGVFAALVSFRTMYHLAVAVVSIHNLKRIVGIGLNFQRKDR